MKQKRFSRRITRWIVYLQQFDFEIVYRKGTENEVADELSKNIKQQENIEDCEINSLYDNEVYHHVFVYLEERKSIQNIPEEWCERVKNESVEFI